MWVIYLEMGVAFALLILIVWWTWPAKRTGSADQAAQDQAAKDEARKEEAP
jgi:cbb3-type cytochrome oxidase subunit 3